MDFELIGEITKIESIVIKYSIRDADVAFFGAMDTADRLTEISAIGDEVNLAARLTSKAAAGEIIVSERALEQAGIDANTSEARSLESKGISEPVRVRVMRGM